MNEFDYLNKTLESLQQQTISNFSIYICVNQPESYLNNLNKQHIYKNNQQLLGYLNDLNMSNLTIIDHSSSGKGWIGKLHGVGQARKVIMDEIIKKADDSDLIVSLDADTLLPNNYLAQIQNAFRQNSKAIGISAPYYHQLTGHSDLDRAILRYEIYMRYYLLNLFRISSPYAFSALGSAMAVSVKAYKKIGGMTPKLSGEDFYFLQKLKKCGSLIIDLPCPVYPAARYSDRVFFGTGPALIKGAGGDWESYPIYADDLFDEIAKTYHCFTNLFTDENLITPLDDFMQSIFKAEKIWQPLRNNNKSADNFVKACHEKLDGLRILQFLKDKNQYDQRSDEEKLSVFIQKYYPLSEISSDTLVIKDFSSDSIETLNKLRNFLYYAEMTERKKLKVLV